MFFALAAYLLWGAFPAYFPLLEPASPVEILAHRIVWTAVVMALVVAITGQWRQVRRLNARTWGLTVVLAVLIAANWLLYVIAVNSDHVADAALGYFINPLVSVALGMLFLKEKLRPLQSASVIIAAATVVFLTVAAGRPPLLGLGLALSFGFYGLLKKRIQASAAVSLAAETAVLTPVAGAYLWYLSHTGAGTFSAFGAGHAALLMSSGVVTAVPLLLFGVAARKIPMSAIGMLQYITPSLQMLWAVFVVHEQLETYRWVGFILIWIAVAVYLVDVLRAAPRRTQHRA